MTESISSSSSSHRRRQSSDPRNTRSSVMRHLTSLKTSPVSRHSHLQHEVLGLASFVKRLEEQTALKGHQGCVNTIAWDETGEFLVSGSDDRFLNIYRPMDAEPLVHRIRSGHRQNIFSAKFLTNSSASKIVSCSAEGSTILTDVNDFVAKSRLDSWVSPPSYSCHTDTTYEVLPDIIDGHIFFDCSDDGMINRYDTRIRTSCNCEEESEPCERHLFVNVNSQLRKPVYRSQSISDRILRSFHNSRHVIGVSAISQRPEFPVYMAAACGDDTVRIYDGRMVDPKNDRKGQVYSFSPYIPHGAATSADGKPINRHGNPERRTLETRITSLKYDPHGSGQLLASYSRGDCYLINPTEMMTMQEEQERDAKNGLLPLPTFTEGSGSSSGSGGDQALGSTDDMVVDPPPSKEIPKDTKGKRRRTYSDSQEEAEEEEKESAAAHPERTTSAQSLPHLKGKSGHPALKKSASTESSKKETRERHKMMHVHFEKDEQDTAGGGSSGSGSSQVQEISHAQPSEKSKTKAEEMSIDKDSSEMPGLASSVEDKASTAESRTRSEEQTTATTANLESDEEERESSIEWQWKPVDSLSNISTDDSISSDTDPGDYDAHEDDEDDDDDNVVFLDTILSGTSFRAKSGRDDKTGSSGDSVSKDDGTKEYWQQRSLRTAKRDMVQAYSGHRNARTMIKEANFFGPNSEFIMSGSDSGRIFFWDKSTAKIVNVVKGDKEVVNCVQGHPVSSFTLAASGIDRTTKIFMPTAEEPVKVSSLRGIKRPTTSAYIVRPQHVTTATTDSSSSSTSLSSPQPINPDDELDPEHAYGLLLPTSDTSDDDEEDDFFMGGDDDFDDYDNEGHDDHGDGGEDDDDHGDYHGYLHRSPQHVLLRLLRHIAEHQRMTSRTRRSTTRSAGENEGEAGDRMEEE